MAFLNLLAVPSRARFPSLDAPDGTSAESRSE